METVGNLEDNSLPEGVPKEKKRERERRFGMETE